MLNQNNFAESQISAQHSPVMLPPFLGVASGEADRSHVSFGHVVDHVTRSKVTFYEHNNSVESIMIETRKHNSMIFRA